MKRFNISREPHRINIFTGLIHCMLCDKNYRHKIANAGKNCEKPVWCCATFNTRGKSACPSQQVPESILIAKTSEVLGFTGWDRKTLMEYVAEIQVPGHNRLVYVFKDGHTQEVDWQNPSRRESWTEEMKQKARERALKKAKSKMKERK